MGIRRLISEFTEAQEYKVLRHLLSKGYELVSVREDRDDMGAYADVFEIDGTDKVIRLLHDDSGVLKVDISIADEAKRYEQLVGEDNDHVVRVFYTKYFEEDDILISILEKLEVVWKDVDNEFSNLFDRIFDTHKIHQKISYVPNKKQLDVIFDRMSDEHTSDNYKFYSSMDDQEKKIIVDAFKGTKELKDKYDIVMNDLHISNIMKDPKSDNYKIIDFGT